MAQPTIQASFNSGEWAPALYARVDMEKYHSGAATLRNFFVDYRGGASTRPGTKYILRGYKSASAIRLISFQASFSVGYVLEFGDLYVRFYNNGAPVLESALNITGATKANPCVLTVANSYNAGDVDWIYVTGVGGMTQLNGKYYIVHARDATHVTLYDLFGNPVDSTGYSNYTAGGTTQRIYTLPSPYLAADLANVKFAQNVNTMILCHPSYAPYILTLTSATNWSLIPIVFGSTVPAPTNVTLVGDMGPSTLNYAYVVTAVDVNGQESGPSTPGTLASKNIFSPGNTINVTWTAVSGAVSYNVYKANYVAINPVPSGAAYGFIGNCTGVSFSDSNIAPDFSLTPPISKNPFQGAGIASVTVTAPGAYTSGVAVTFGAAPAGGTTAIGQAVLSVISATIVNGGLAYSARYPVYFPNGVVLIIHSVDAFGTITAFEAINYTGANPGSVISGSVPTNPVSSTGTGSPSGFGATVNLTWGVTQVQVLSPGAGYASAPAVTFASGAATATSTLGPASNGNPSVPGFFQQRLVLAGQANAVQTMFMSQPGSYFNFDVSNPIQESDAITATLVSGQLGAIQSMVPQPSGLIVLTDKISWLVNGGSSGSAVTPSSIVATAQSFNGAHNLPPIVATFDVLYVQAKGSIVRDSAFNFYANVYTGTDISVLSSHLFYGYNLVEWAWAEEPFKVVWTVRDDGTMLTLTFLKEQELIAWAHSDTTNGLFKSVATVTETVGTTSLDAVYTVVERTINSTTVKYIERIAERSFPNGVTDAWCVDAGLQYNGVPATSFSGGEHLVGQTVTGLADGVIIPPFVMAASGNFTLTTPASKVTVGLGFTAQLKTLPIDLGAPTIQSKVKKIPGVTVRVENTLGLTIGSDFSHQVAIKDLVRGNVSGMLTGQATQTVTGLVTGDAYQLLDPTYTVPGQYCIQQSNPYPATILGVIPEIAVGDTK